MNIVIAIALGLLLVGMEVDQHFIEKEKKEWEEN